MKRGNEQHIKCYNWITVFFYERYKFCDWQMFAMILLYYLLFYKHLDSGLISFWSLKVKCSVFGAAGQFSTYNVPCHTVVIHAKCSLASFCCIMKGLLKRKKKKKNLSIIQHLWYLSRSVSSMTWTWHYSKTSFNHHWCMTSICYTLTSLVGRCSCRCLSSWHTAFSAFMSQLFWNVAGVKI